jgi:hypothetical protein
MACNSLGLFSSALDPINACTTLVSTKVFGEDKNLGSILYSNSGCTATLLPSYWSDGVNVYNVNGSGIIQGITGCSCSQFFCVENDTTYEDQYRQAGTFAGFNYFTGQTTDYVIYYSTGETRWCLAQNLGDPCDQFGTYGSTSTCPDFDDSVSYSGLCVTTTTTVNPCATFDFESVFDCYIPPTPSVTPTLSYTPTPTPTPSSTEICGGKSMTLVVNKFTPTPTGTPTPTPSATPEITRPCNYSGQVIFNSINEVIQCANSKKFKDCFTGINYYTTDLVLVSGTTSPKEGYVYNATINGYNYCVIFEGLFENISGVDNVELTNEVGPSNLGACLDCTPINPSPILECIVVHSECGTVNVSPSGFLNGKLFYTWTFPNQNTEFKIYWDTILNAWAVVNTISNNAGSYLYIDSQLPVGSSSDWEDSQTYVTCIESSANFYTTLLEVPCPSLTPTPTPTPSPTPCVQYTYQISNTGKGKVAVQYTVCGENNIQTISIGGSMSITLCSATTPTSNNPQNVIIIQSPFVC